MLDLSTKSIEWIFSGIGVAILGVIAKWLCSKRKNETKETSTYSVHQINIGSGKTVGRDEITKE
jgi:hypothetical protein